MTEKNLAQCNVEDLMVELIRDDIPFAAMEANKKIFNGLRAIQRGYGEVYLRSAIFDLEKVIDKMKRVQQEAKSLAHEELNIS